MKNKCKQIKKTKCHIPHSYNGHPFLVQTMQENIHAKKEKLKQGFTDPSSKPGTVCQYLLLKVRLCPAVGSMDIKWMKSLTCEDKEAL